MGANVSIHLMFLLIEVVHIIPRFLFSFNTSHVSINLFVKWLVNLETIVSIHLMFLLILTSL